MVFFFFFFFQAEDGIRDLTVTGVQTCALPISRARGPRARAARGSAAASVSESGGFEGRRRTVELDVHGRQYSGDERVALGQALGALRFGRLVALELGQVQRARALEQLLHGVQSVAQDVDLRGELHNHAQHPIGGRVSKEREVWHSGRLAGADDDPRKMPLGTLRPRAVSANVPGALVEGQHFGVREANLLEEPAHVSLEQMWQVRLVDARAVTVHDEVTKWVTGVGEVEHREDAAWPQDAERLV